MEKKEIKKSTPNLSEEFLTYAKLDADQVTKELHTSHEHGLTTEQVKNLHAKFGKNQITTHELSLWQLFFNQIKSPFIYLLVIIAIIDFSLGEFADGIMISLLVVVNTAFSFYQEFRTYHALQLLKRYISDHIRVMRDGKEIEINTTELVPGDLIKIYQGDRVPADIRLISAESLTVDEAVLTGESAPVQKNNTPITDNKISIFNANNIAFSGTTVLNGKGIGIVLATGNKSYFGSIATMAEQAPKLSSFSLGINRFSKFILYLVLITVAAVFLIHLFFNSKLSIIELISFAIALGISIIPEALPIVITFSLARGALHLAKAKVITKRLSSIEDLGSMDTLCVDKTGTISENKMQFVASYGPDMKQTLLYGILSSGLSPETLEKDVGFNGPLWKQLSDTEKKQIAQYKVIAEQPFNDNLHYAGIIVRADHKDQLIVRGNFKEVLALCNKLTDAQRQELIEWDEKESTEGHRVVALAKKEFEQEATQIKPELAKDLNLVGLISYEDPLKKTAQESIERARKLGVAIKIISGDVPEVNTAIGKKIGLIKDKNDVLSGQEFAQLSASQKLKAVKDHTIFAHIVPDQKVEIVQLLEEQADVGYLGDGVNDAPALKVAHVSMAVDTAADIAKDQADIILLHKSLRVIVNGIHEGRVIFANIIKYIKSTLAANFGHFYSLAIISLLIDYLPMLPSQLLLISLLTDLPLIAISTDTVSIHDINKPRKYDLKDIALVSMILGLVVMVADFVVFKIFSGGDHAVLQTNWFITSVLIELSFFYSIRTSLLFFKGTRPSFPVMTFSIIIACIAIALPFTSVGHYFLHFKSPTRHDLLIIGIILICYFLITDIVKVIFYKIYNSNGGGRIDKAL